MPGLIVSTNWTSSTAAPSGFTRPAPCCGSAWSAAEAAVIPEPLLGIRIVIVDDDDDTRDILRQVLEHLGATVTTVGRARAALSMVGMADVIVTDFLMPQEDGVWLLDHVNQHPQPIPVISISGFAETQRPRLAQAPFARKLLKPVDPSDLGRIIGEVMRGESPASPLP